MLGRRYWLGHTWHPYMSPLLLGSFVSGKWVFRIFSGLLPYQQ